MLIKNQKCFKTITIIFIIIQLLLQVLIQITSDYFNTIVSYLAVIDCFLYGVLFIYKDRNVYLMIAGLLFTLFADLFLVVIEPMLQIPAMICFSIVQILYFIYIYLNQSFKKHKKFHLLVRLVLIIIIMLMTIIVLKNKTDFLSLISVFYYVNLIVNIIFSFITNNKNIIFSIGLILFSLCDLLIGLNVLVNSYLSINTGSFIYFLANPGFNLAWIFYVPSQTLIALSIYKDKIIKK